MLHDYPSSEIVSVTPTNPSVLPSREYAAFLFDMDGTILTSIKSAERVCYVTRTLRSAPELEVVIDD